MMRHIFQQVIEGFVTEESLAQLKARELRAVAMILGIGPVVTSQL